MVQCPACRIPYVANTIFCPECGLYLLEDEEIGTGPLEAGTPAWKPGAASKTSSSGTGLTSIRLRIRPLSCSEIPPTSQSSVRLSHSFTTRLGESNCENRHKANKAQVRELEVPLTKPIRLGRIDPREGVYPDIDLTADLAMEHGVSREHACIFRRGDVIEVEDLASTNGTMLNGTRLAPYLPVPLKHGDQLQLGKLVIEVCFGASQREPRQHRPALRAPPLTN